MFALLGLVVGFAALAGLLWLVDHIAYQRGFGGAHPLSPAVAWAAVLGMFIMLFLLVAGMNLDKSPPTSASLSNTSEGGKGAV